MEPLKQLRSSPFYFFFRNLDLILAQIKTNIKSPSERYQLPRWKDRTQKKVRYIHLSILLLINPCSMLVHFGIYGRKQSGTSKNYMTFHSVPQHRFSPRFHRNAWQGRYSCTRKPTYLRYRP
jgi:hypothetical protein